MAAEKKEIIVRILFVIGAICCAIIIGVCSRRMRQIDDARRAYRQTHFESTIVISRFMPELLTEETPVVADGSVSVEVFEDEPEAVPTWLARNLSMQEDGEYSDDLFVHYGDIIEFHGEYPEALLIEAETFSVDLPCNFSLMNDSLHYNEGEVTFRVQIDDDPAGWDEHVEFVSLNYGKRVPVRMEYENFGLWNSAWFLCGVTLIFIVFFFASCGMAFGYVAEDTPPKVSRPLTVKNT